jgi:hypothetical protein
MTTDRKIALLADRALDGLPEDEARLLEELGGAHDDSFDRAAAALALAELSRTGDAEPLPEALAARILSAAPSPRPATGTLVDPATAPGTAAARARARWSSWGTMGWVAAAAAGVVAFLGWSRPPEVVEKVQVVEVKAPPPRVPTAAEARAELLAAAPDARTIPWTATADADARGATGDVVWSEGRQQGYMRIRGLATNDPGSAQYQLWIFDGKRNAAHPVDGGVFDVQGGEVVIPIRAAVKVFEPKLFAITVEKPGGVVVSKRERIVLTAAL